MKITKEIQFIQNRCIEKAHPGLSLEEAREIEVDMIGCIVGYSLMDGGYEEGHGDTYQYGIISGVSRTGASHIRNGYDDVLPFYLNCDDEEYKIGGYVIDGERTETEIFGLPPCLARVLNGLSNACEIDGMIYTTDGGGSIREYVCEWRLLNSDGSPATLFDQTDETIKEIAEEMGFIN